MKVSKAERVADRVIAELGGQPGEPPTSRELGAWIDGGGCPAEALEAAARSLGEMGTTFPNVEGTLAIAYGAVNPRALRLQRGRLLVELDAPTIVVPKTEERGVLDAGTVIGVKWLVEAMAARWESLEPAQRPKFPLAPLVRAWHDRPRPAMLSTRTTGRIFPAKLAMAPRTDRRAGNLFSHAAHVGEQEGELVLPGFQTARAAPALPLQLYDLGLGAAHSEKTTGAPLALRMFVESILAISQEDRRGDGPVAISIALRDLLDRLYPGPREPRPNEYWPRLMKAAEALDSMEARMPWHDPETGCGGLRRVVSVGDIPRGPGALDDLVRIVVDLPPGSRNGPQVSDNLGRWGLKHRREYRALLNLAFWWHNPGQTVRPVGQRADGKGRHWQQSAAAAYYPTMSDAELVDIVFPTSRRTRVGNLLGEARQVLKNLERAGELRVLEDKVLPPLNPPPRHG